MDTSTVDTFAGADGNHSSAQPTDCTVTWLLSVRIVYKYCCPVLGSLGIIGNIFNMFILTHRSWSRISRLERFSHTGFIALAISDSLVCLGCLPLGVTTDPSNVSRQQPFDFILLHRAYGSIFINVFMLCSTFLTVSVSVVRYLSIVFPLEARVRVGRALTRNVLIVACLLAVACNVPRVFLNKISAVRDDDESEDDQQRYETRSYHRHWEREYHITYFVIAIIIPTLTLAFCTFFLIIHLRQKKDPVLHASIASSRRGRNSVSRTTSIVLVAIVIQYMLLVFPIQTLSFYEHTLVSRHRDVCRRQDTVRTVKAVGNLMELLNFASNFILYLSLNTNFRRALHNLSLDVKHSLSGSTPEVEQKRICDDGTPLQPPLARDKLCPKDVVTSQSLLSVENNIDKVN